MVQGKVRRSCSTTCACKRCCAKMCHLICDLWVHVGRQRDAFRHWLWTCHTHSPVSAWLGKQRWDERMCLPRNSVAAAYWRGHNFPRQVGPKGKCLVIGAKPCERLQGDSWSQQCWGGQVLGDASSGGMRGEFIWCYSKPRQRSVRQQHFYSGTVKVSHSSSTWALLACRGSADFA